MIKIILDQLDSLRLKQMELSNSISSTNLQLEKVSKKLDLLIPAIEVIKQVSENFSKESLEQLQITLSDTLKVIFNRDYNLKISIEEKYNKRNVVFTITNDMGIECNLLNIGGGLVSVISFLVQLYFINLMKLRPILFLDESFVFLAEEFISNLISMIKELCNNGWTIILITHRSDIADAADNIIYLKKSDGELKIDKLIKK